MDEVAVPRQATILELAMRRQERNWAALAGRVSRSSNVRKSMVLNSRSRAGGAQILAPRER
jgi:hypothetical protein